MYISYAKKKKRLNYVMNMKKNYIFSTYVKLCLVNFGKVVKINANSEIFFSFKFYVVCTQFYKSIIYNICGKGTLFSICMVWLSFQLKMFVCK